MCVWPFRCPQPLTPESPAFPPGAEVLPELAAPLASSFLTLSFLYRDSSVYFAVHTDTVKIQDCLYSAWGVCCTSVSLWLRTVKLALSLVYLGIKNIWGVLWLNQSFLLGSMHEPSLFLFLSLCKSTTVVANKCLDVLPTYFFSFSDWERLWMRAGQVQYLVS